MSTRYGGVVSSILNVAVVVAVFPQASVAVKVTSALPVAPQPSLNAVKLFVHNTGAHSALEAAPPFAPSQFVSSSLLLGPH